MPFGQLVVGPPGSGKTTYCTAMRHFLRALGREAVVINLDPASGTAAGTAAADVDIAELVTVDDVMARLGLGPNGALVYCMEYLEEHVAWLDAALARLPARGYLLLDMPGQIELYTHHDSVRRLVRHVEKQQGVRLAAVHLVDSQCCADLYKFVGAVLTSLATMVQLELPAVNVLSKIDLVGQIGPLDFRLDFFTDVLDLSYVIERLRSDTSRPRFQALNAALCDVISDYALVAFHTLSVRNKESMAALLRTIDRANGFSYGGLDASNVGILQAAAAANMLSSDRVLEDAERYLGSVVERAATPTDPE